MGIETIAASLSEARDAIEEKWESKTLQKNDKKITLKTQRKGGRVYAEVRDSGVGIPRSISDRIFEPFFTTKNIGKGTGLGLSISYRIVQDFDGNIQVVSTAGEGARFIIDFPAADN